MKVTRLARIAWAAALFLASAGASSVLAQPAQGGRALKHTIAVDAFGGGDLTEGAASPESLNALLTDALLNDGHFIVVERAGLAGVQGEQQLGQSGAALSTNRPCPGPSVSNFGKSRPRRRC